MTAAALDDQDLAEARAFLKEAAQIAMESMRDLQAAQLAAETVADKAVAARAVDKVGRGLRMTLLTLAKLKRERLRLTRERATDGPDGPEQITMIRRMIINAQDQGTAHAVRDCILTETEGEEERCRELFDRLDAWLEAPDGKVLWLPADQQVDHICVAIGLHAELKPDLKTWPVKGPSRRLLEGLPPFPGPDEDKRAAGFL